jgi:hypothetical protein
MTRLLRRQTTLAVLALASLYSAPTEAFIGVPARTTNASPAGYTLVPSLTPAPWRKNIRPDTRASSSSLSNGMWSEDDELEGSDKFKACIPYLLPLLDGEAWGKYIYDQIPPLGFLDSLFVGPLYETYSHVPFLGLVLFIAFTLGTRGNTEISRNVRFNAQQACMIDITLVVPELLGSGFEGDDTIPRWLQEPCMNFVWYFYMSAVLYSIFCNLRGKKPDQIPWISGYAELLVGPF